MKLASPAFENAEKIPYRLTCDGGAFSPPLTISDVPAKVLMGIRGLFSGRVATSAMLLTAVLAIAFLSPALAQEEPAAGSETTLEQELAKLNQTMREIAELMRTYIARQEVDMIMKRIELHRRYLTPLEQELRSTRTGKASVEDEIERMEVIVDELEEEIARNESAGNEESANHMRLEKERLAVNLKLLKDRRWTLEQRIIELENELVSRRHEIQALEEIADEQLGLR